MPTSSRTRKAEKPLAKKATAKSPAKKSTAKSTAKPPVKKSLAKSTTKPKPKVQRRGGGSAVRRERGRVRTHERTGTSAKNALLPQARIFVAIDEIGVSRAVELQAQLLPYVGGFKLGAAFLLGRPPDLVHEIFGAVPLFLDFKLHDIPNTVAQGMRRLCQYRPQIITVHAAGGLDMMKRAADTAQEMSVVSQIPRPAVVAITTLTSLSDSDLRATGQRTPLRDQVLRLAELAWKAGMDGVVAAPQDLVFLRKAMGQDFWLVSPGIRPKTSELHDHKRSLTPREALDNGADFLVIGRPLTQAKDPVAAVRSILKSLGQKV